MAMHANTFRIFNVLKEDEEREDDPNAEFLEVEAHLTALESRSEEVTSLLQQITAACGMQLSVMHCHQLASTITKIRSDVVMSAGIYCANREHVVKNPPASPEPEELVRHAMWVTWCHEHGYDSYDRAPDAFYEFLYSYKDAVHRLGRSVESCKLWLENKIVSDKKWWGGTKHQYIDSLRMVDAAVKISSVETIYSKGR